MTSSGRRGAKRPRPKRGKPVNKSRARLSLIVEEKSWASDPRAISLIRRAVRAALPKSTHGAVTILLSGDARLKELNSLFRGKPKSTNVLSFPADDAKYLGDVAIAYGATAREARGQGKAFAAHAAHLAVHGVLHLLGYDHENDRDAKIMEAHEARILARLGLPDPYARVREAA